MKLEYSYIHICRRKVHPEYFHTLYKVADDDVFEFAIRSLFHKKMK